MNGHYCFDELKSRISFFIHGNQMRLLPYSTFFVRAINFAFEAVQLFSVTIYYNELWQQGDKNFVFLVNQDKKNLFACQVVIV